MSTILIVDDEARIREVIKEYGSLYQYNVLEAENGLQAIDVLKNNQVDCLILDIMMPVMDGYTACKKIREFSNVPVVMLSARTEEEDKLLGFELGVDDYVSKPFSPKELMARVGAILKRVEPANTSNDSLIKVEGIVIDTEAYIVKIDSQEVHLTFKEYQLLVYLIENAGIVLSRERLLQNIWGEDSFSYDRTVDTHVKMLRKNLGKYADKVVTVRGVGYKFEK